MESTWFQRMSCRIMHLHWSMWLGNVFKRMSRHTHLTTLPLDIAHGKRAVTSANKPLQIYINLPLKEHLFSEFTAVNGQKKYSISSSFKHIHLYIHVLYTLGWAGHKQNKKNYKIVSVLKSKTEQFYHCFWLKLKMATKIFNCKLIHKQSSNKTI